MTADPERDDRPPSTATAASEPTRAERRRARAACRRLARRSVARVAPTISSENDTAIDADAGQRRGPQQLDRACPSRSTATISGLRPVIAGPRRDAPAEGGGDQPMSTQTTTTIGPSAPSPKTLLIP